MRASRLLMLCLAALTGLAAPARAELDRTRFQGAAPAVEVTFPTDWVVTEQASFPGLLATATDTRYGGRLTLSLERRRDDESLKDCVERNHTALAKLRFQPQPIGMHATGAFVIQAITPDGKKAVRQAYRAFEGDDTLVFVLTLSAGRSTMQRYVRAFDDTLRGLTRLPDPAPAAVPAERDEAGIDE